MVVCGATGDLVGSRCQRQDGARVEAGTQHATEGIDGENSSRKTKLRLSSGTRREAGNALPKTVSPPLLLLLWQRDSRLDSASRGSTQLIYIRKNF